MCAMVCMLNCGDAPKYLVSALEWCRTTHQLCSSGRQLVVPHTCRGVATDHLMWRLPDCGMPA